jgi:hypothetical protein
MLLSEFKEKKEHRIKLNFGDPSMFIEKEEKMMADV